MPWETVSRLVDACGLEPRQVETLIGLDEYTGAGVEYYEAVVGGDVQLGKKVANW